MQYIAVTNRALITQCVRSACQQIVHLSHIVISTRFVTVNILYVFYCDTHVYDKSFMYLPVFAEDLCFRANPESGHQQVRMTCV